jgi:hypothetical protein
LSYRKPDLEEWFLAHQMRSLVRRHAHLPGSLECDITGIARRAAARGARLSYPAIVIKALAMAAARVPEINRCYVPTLLGDRVVEFDHISVNVPVALREGGGRHLFGAVIRHADRLSASEIAAKLREAQNTPLDETRLTKYVARKPNNLMWRSILRGVHFASYNLPVWHKLAGGLSVSSLLTHRGDPPRARAVSFGPTAVTVLVCNVRSAPRDKTILELGLGVDHAALGGLAARRGTDALHDILASTDPETLAWFD